MVVLVGLGQLGSVFAHGLLRRGHTVVPVNRGDDLQAAARRAPDPELVLVTVGEKDLDAVLSALPAPFRGTVGLVQNGLLPPDWEKHGLRPTVAVVWFEKKKDIPPTPILPTPIAGPKAALLAAALEAVDLPAEVVEEDALVDALVLKNVYIATFNLAALAPGVDPSATVGELWRDRRPLVEALANDVLALEEARLGRKVDRDAVLGGLRRAVEADPNHRARGRSAPARLARARALAAELGVATPAIGALTP